MTEQTTSWTDIQAEVLRRIRARDWPPGALLPTEPDLAREFGCARATVSRALQSLAAQGVLDRRRRAGTRVSLAPVRRATLAIPLIRDEIEAAGAIYRHVPLACDQARAAPAIAARMGVAPGHVLLHVRALHLADGRTHLVEERWINPDMAPGVLNADLSTESANEWLVRNTLYAEGEIALTAEPCGEETAALLDIAPGSAVLVLDRQTRTETGPITWARLTHRPEHRMIMQL